MNWRPISELPEDKPERPAVHALCWARWPDGGEFFRRGYFHEGKWNLDWDGSFDNDDSIPSSSSGNQNSTTAWDGEKWRLELTPPDDQPTPITEAALREIGFEGGNGTYWIVNNDPDGGRVVTVCIPERWASIGEDGQVVTLPYEIFVTRARWKSIGAMIAGGSHA